MMQSPRGVVRMSDKELKRSEIELQEILDLIQRMQNEIIELYATRSKLETLGGLYIRSYLLKLEINRDDICNG